MNVYFKLIVSVLSMKIAKEMKGKDVKQHISILGIIKCNIKAPELETALVIFNSKDMHSILLYIKSHSRSPYMCGLLVGMRSAVPCIYREPHLRYQRHCTPPPPQHPSKIESIARSTAFNMATQISHTASYYINVNPH